jgi:hypothetical protein
MDGENIQVLSFSRFSSMRVNRLRRFQKDVVG